MRWFGVRVFSWFCGLGLLALAGCGPALEVLEGPTMGSRYRLQYVPLAGMDKAALQLELEGILADLDRQFSTYRDDSLVSRFNALPAGACLELTADMLQLWRYGAELAQQSGGAFDLTLEPLLNLWGFGAQSRRQQAPDVQAREEVLRRVGWRHLHLQGNALCKDAAVALNFDSLVAGLAVDKIAARLDALGVENYLLDVTGELKARGHRPDGAAWRVALEVPEDTSQRQMERLLALNGYALSTSGDYRNYFQVKGVRYSHILDPRSGAPVQHALAAVSVAERQALHADALSTVLMVLGPDAGYDFAVQHRLAALFIVRQGQGFNSRATPEFQRLFPAKLPL